MESKVNIKNIKVSDLKPYENNPRNNEGAVAYLVNSIKSFGFKVPIVVDKDNVIVAGHTRWLAAQELGLKEVPCLIADDLTPKQIKAFRIADNKIAEKSSWDFTKLAEEVDALGDVDLTDFGFGEFEIDVLKNGTEIDNSTLDDIFSDAPTKEKEPKKVQCPHCGEWFEV